MQKIFEYVNGLIPKGLDFAIDILIALIVLVVGLKVAQKIVKGLKKSLMKRDMEVGAITFFCSALKVSLYVLLFIIAAQILGFATSSVIALVGSAGLAIGLALQGSLANFAGGVLILLMKPFVVGDYIIVDSIEGTVTKIDVVYTTLVTVDNRSVILPNGKLADSDIVNNTREGKRRLDVEVGIEYSENIPRVRKILLEVGERQENRLEDTDVNVVVSSLDDSAVMMMVQIWVHPDNYKPSMFALLEDIKLEFDRNDITIPFQQVDVMVHKE